MSSGAVQTFGLTKRYADNLALEDLNLVVNQARVFGYLGPNGAGKTTTIRLLMGMLNPTSGRATIAGLDCHSNRNRVHEIVGYLPGDFFGYDDLTATEYLTYLANLRTGTDWRTTTELIERFALKPDRKIGNLSHGNRQKVGIIQAFMHKPKLLILDEPTAGLDPIMQREFLALIREAREEGQTVFLSSHVLSEVEEVADDVGILRAGRLITIESLDNLKARARRRIDLTFSSDAPMGAIRAIDNVHSVLASDRTLHVTVEGSMDELFRVAAPHGIDHVSSPHVDLEQIFLDFYEEPDGGEDV